jgi:AcrR family transcriptional regulator
VTEASSKREKQKEERRKQILEAALTIFSQKGFHATNVSDVAAQAGVSQGTIYWYFESKEELFTAALLSFFEDFGEEMVAALDACVSASEKLRALGKTMEDFAEGAAGLLMLFLGYWASTPNREEVGRFWVDLLVEFKDTLAGIIEEGVRNGEFKPVDADSVVWAFMAAYDGLAAYVMLIPDMDLGKVSRAFVEVLLSGLQDQNRGKGRKK